MATQQITQPQLPATVTGTKVMYGGNGGAGLGKNKFYTLSGISPTVPPATTGLDIEVLVPFAGTLRNLYLRSDVVAAGAGEIFTVYINGAASTLTATIAAAAQTGSDTTHFPTVAAGDRISLFYENGSDGNIGFAGWGVELRAS